MVGLRLLCWKDRGAGPPKVPRKIDVDVLAAVSDCRLPVQSSDVPDAVGDPPAVKLVGVAPVDSFAQFARFVIRNRRTRPMPLQRVESRSASPNAGLVSSSCVAPLAIKGMPQEVGQPPEDRVHLASDQASNVGLT